MMNGNVTNNKTSINKSIKIQTKNCWGKFKIKFKNFQKMIFWILNSISFNLFERVLLFLALPSIILKYLDKLIKCLEMRANIHLYSKIGHFSTHLNFDEICFFGYFKSHKSKWPKNVKICHMFEVIEIVQAGGISKYFLTGLKEHTVPNFIV